MKKGGGKAKGSAFEREIAKLFTLWASGQSKEYWYWRSPSSGAVATITDGNGDISGDLIALKPEGTFLTSKYSIEIKTGYPNSSFHKHLKGVKTDEIRDFWKQCCFDASKAEKRPMLIYQKKQFNTLIGISTVIDKLKYIPSLTMTFGADILLPCHFYDLSEFLNIITPEDIELI